MDTLSFDSLGRLFEKREANLGNGRFQAEVRVEIGDGLSLSWGQVDLGGVEIRTDVRVSQKRFRRVAKGDEAIVSQLIE